MSLKDKLEALNQADLSTLMKRLAAIRAAAEAELGAQSARPVTTDDLKLASQQTGLTPEQLIEALETAQRRGLI